MDRSQLSGLTGWSSIRAPARPVEWPAVVGQIPAAAAAFQPRPWLREQIDLARGSGGGVVLTPVLSGGGGTGKSQLAARCARDASRPAFHRCPARPSSRGFCRRVNTGSVLAGVIGNDCSRLHSASSSARRSRKARATVQLAQLLLDFGDLVRVPVPWNHHLLAARVVAVRPVDECLDLSVQVLRPDHVPAR